MKKLLASIAGCAALMAASISLAGPVNINTADAETLAAELTGVGPALANAIIEDRRRNGPFSSAEELARVSGIGERVVALNRGNILVADSEKSD
jgi:competence protein ComEA